MAKKRTQLMPRSDLAQHAMYKCTWSYAMTEDTHIFVCADSYEHALALYFKYLPEHPDLLRIERVDAGVIFDGAVVSIRDTYRKISKLA